MTLGALEWRRITTEHSQTTAYPLQSTHYRGVQSDDVPVVTRDGPVKYDWASYAGGAIRTATKPRREPGPGPRKTAKCSLSRGRGEWLAT